ncbi:MAG: T9SS type A sorting domain-containing protein [candidate division Zixibacteria bacterium]|nr:T9SS type A sorting domain-containing protein [Candidatus Tariuqbacter arcticus]
MRKAIQLIITVGLLLALAGGGCGQDSLNINKVSETYSFWDNIIKSMVIVDDYIIASIGQSGLRIINKANPDSLYEVGYLHLNNIVIGDMILDDNYLYTTGCTAYGPWQWYTKIFDISNPILPVEIGSCNIGGCNIAKEGDYLYAAGGFVDGLHVIDITDPEYPYEAAYLAIESYGGSHVCISNDIAYYVNGAAWYIIDIANPLSPQVMDSVVVTDPIEVEVYEDYAYIIDGSMYYEESSNLVIFDISNPVSPVQVNIVILSAGGSMIFHNDYLYLSDWGYYQSSRIIDINDPISAIINATIYDCTPRYVDNDFIYAYGYNWPYPSDLRLYDNSNPTNPEFYSIFSVKGYIWNSIRIGDYIYIADLREGLRKLDISDIENPEEVEVLDVQFCDDWPPKGLAGQDSFVYIAAENDGLICINTSEPMTIVWEYDPYDYFPNDLHIQDDYLYTACWDKMQIWDISNGPPLQLISTLEINCETVYVDGALLFTTSDHLYSDSLHIVDISDVLNPEVIYSGGYYEIKDAIASGNTLYMNRSSVYAYDITDPTNPELISIITGNGCIDMDLYDNYLIGSFISSISIYDVSDPINSEMVGYYEGTVYAVGIAADENYIYLADKLRFGIYDWSQCGSEVEFQSEESPITFTLSPPYPNPFNSSTAISYQLPAASFVELTVYDILGREIARLIDCYRLPGEYKAIWEADDAASGVYFVKLTQGEDSVVRKALLIK